ncbi:MAG: aminotransferase class V-fold PLP-dependent enzyme, partial [Candidatus Coatesbacteria bacterium]|nr:aminotransferase class V-fold PLP-dependent enzyme [Candidatus Coatesbacteria bacterium]
FKPIAVVEAMNEYYYAFPGCHGRTTYYFGRRTTEEYDRARERLAKLINAPQSKELIFVRNSSEGINLIANSLPFQKGDVVVTTNIEHNSNLLPWHVLKRRKGIEHMIVKLNDDLTFDRAAFERAMSDRVRLVSVVHTSNLTGVSMPIKQIAAMAHRHGALVMVDGAQSVAHSKVDVQDLGIDILVFSVHKMMGPTGFGVLWAKEEVLNKLEPFIVGGETVLNTFYDSYVPAGLPDRFEAGLQNYAGAIGAGVAAEFLMELGRDEVHEHEVMLNRVMTDGLKGIDGLKIIGPADPELRGGILNIAVDGMKALEVARILDETSNIMVRAGFLCVHSWYNANELPHSIRASVYVYNTPDECELFASVLKQLIKHYR